MKIKSISAAIRTLLKKKTKPPKFKKIYSDENVTMWEIEVV
jgi:hypothetical protein